MIHMKLVLLLLLAQLALPIEGTGEETKNGLQETSTQSNVVQVQNSEQTEEQIVESSTIVTEGYPETTNTDSTTHTIFESPEPEDKNVVLVPSTDFKEERRSKDDKQAHVLELQHPSKSNSHCSTPETNDTQSIGSKPQEVYSWEGYDNKTLVLVLSSDSQPQTNIHNVCMNDKPVKLYVPVRGCKYVEIKDKDVTIWKAQKEEYAYMVYETIVGQESKMIMIESGGGATNKYCYKIQGAGWQKLMLYTFYLKIFMPLESEKEYTVYDLDTSRNDSKNNTVVECHLDEVHTKMYFDKKGNRAGVIRYGDQKLYEITSLLETFSKVNISLLFGRPVFLDIELFTLAFKRNVRFQMFNGEWKAIPSTEYNENMERYREYHKNQRNENSDVVALNLSEPNEEKVQIVVRSPQDFSVSTIEYVPKDGKKMGYIITEGHIIWASSHGEECTVMSTYKNNVAVLVMIEYKDDRPTEFLCYEDRWFEVHKQKYYDKIVDIYTM
ncbi:hypothetical protein MACK_003443 [Theileria orientalis]|uniref:Signal peptide containing protein n=1 Tax=Theileria orientalis TaxID=68886 RepID=A0A976XJA0_THEOR|nr:hypothetical protein MACK_003443 [Theileria orientalis]